MTSTKNPKLEAILEYCGITDWLDEENLAEYNSKIQAALDWIIGDDEGVSSNLVPDPSWEHRNELRAEQRKRLNQFCGKEQG